MRYRKILAQIEIKRSDCAFDIARADQRERQAMQLLPDGIVFFAEFDQLAELVLELAALVAQRQDLAFAQRNRAPAVRMRNHDGREKISLLFEKFGMLLEISNDRVGCHVCPLSCGFLWKS